MAVRWWRRWLARFRPTHRVPARARPKQSRVCLGLEGLEGRWVPAVHTWRGSMTNLLWSNAANWDGGAPQPGETNVQLIFGSEAAANLRATTNDIAGLTLTSLRFLADGYSIGSNAFTLVDDGQIQTEGTTTLTATLNTPVTLAGVVRVNVGLAGSVVLLNGVLGGAGGLTKLGPGRLDLAGPAANTYEGVTTVNEGTLHLNKAPNVTAVPAALVIGDGTGGANVDIVSLRANHQIADAAAVTVNASGHLDVSVFTETLGALTLTGGNVTTSTETGALTLGANVTVNAAAAAATIGGRLELGVGPRTFTVADGAAADDLVISASISGAAELVKAGPGRMVLARASSYTGVTRVNAGALTIRDVLALGAGGTDNGTVVAATAALELEGTLTIAAEELTLNGTGVSNGGALRNVVGDTNTWAGVVTLETDSAVGVAAGRLTLTGVIGGGARGVTKVGPGTLVFGGSAANTYTGATTVNEGALLLSKPAGVNAVAGPLVIGDGTGGANLDVVRLTVSNQIADTSQVTVTSSGLLDLAGFAETVGPLALTAGNVTTGSGTLTLAGNVTSNAAATAATVAGNLSFGAATRTFIVADGAAADDLVITAVMGLSVAEAGLTKEGPGTLRLGGANTYTGPTTVSAGTLLVDGTQPGSAITVAAGGTLGGTGTVGEVTVNGTLAPGAGPGVLRAGAVSFAAGATFRVELNGTQPGAGHDQLNVTNNVRLNGATLNASLGFASTGGSQYTIVRNDGPDTELGTFNGLAEGATLTVNSRPFRISYRGGDGNDIVLTDISSTTTTTLTASAATTVFGQQVTFTAVVAPAADPGSPTGRVTFRDGDTVLGTADLQNGRATFTTSALPTGTRVIRATYEGDALFSASTSVSLSQTVTRANTAVALAISVGAPVSGQSVTLTVTLTVTPPGAGTPTGTVTFRDGTTVLGTAPLTDGRTATLTTAALAAGTRSLTAEFSGDTNFAASTSPALSQTVGKARTSVALTSSGGSVNVTAAVTFTATVTILAPGGGTLQGSVVFRDGTTVLGTVPVNGNGVATLTTTGLFGGSRQITASFEGSANFEASTSASVALTVTGTSNQLFVAGLYRTVFRRTPDINGLTFFVTQLESGASRLQLAQTFWRSSEYAGIQVDGFYQTFFARPADPGGRTFWIQQFQAGASELNVQVGFVTSAEYRNARPTDTDYVSGLYQNILGRPGEAGSQAAFVQQLQSGTTRDVVAARFLETTERFGRVVDQHAQNVLGRAPDPATRQNYVSQMTSGVATPLTVGEALTISQEFFTRVGA